MRCCPSFCLSRASPSVENGMQGVGAEIGRNEAHTLGDL